MRKINKIIIHCSDSDIVSHDNIETVRYWHVVERKWSDVGYHFFINKNGDFQIGRPIHISGAHCSGENSDSIGICLAGRSYFTEEQKDTLVSLCKQLIREFGLTKDDVYPHNHFNKSKSCPNFNLAEVLETLSI